MRGQRTASVRTWLLHESPATRAQARLGQAYRVTRALARNPLAMVGLVIVVGLVVVAAAAPWLAPYSPIAGDLANRLAPPSGAHSPSSPQRPATAPVW